MDPIQTIAELGARLTEAQRQVSLLQQIVVGMMETFIPANEIEVTLVNKPVQVSPGEDGKVLVAVS